MCFHMISGNIPADLCIDLNKKDRECLNRSEKRICDFGVLQSESELPGPQSSKQDSAHTTSDQKEAAKWPTDDSQPLSLFLCRLC
jgi:hypothetical protein